MKRSDFYDSYRKELKVDFLENYGLVEYWACKTFGLSRSNFVLLLKLHALGTFITADFQVDKNIFAWDAKKQKFFMKNDWIEVYRRRDGSAKNYNVYRVTKRCRRIFNGVYKKLLKEEEISTSPRSNPLFRSDAPRVYTFYRNAVIAFNKEVRLNKKK